MVEGQPAAFRLSAAGMPAADEVPDADVVADAGPTGVLLLLLLLLLAQAVAVSARAVPMLAARAIRADLLWGVGNVSPLRLRPFAAGVATWGHVCESGRAAGEGVEA
jgi:hypothetical protein